MSFEYIVSRVAKKCRRGIETEIGFRGNTQLPLPIERLRRMHTEKLSGLDSDYNRRQIKFELDSQYKRGHANVISDRSTFFGTVSQQCLYFKFRWNNVNYKVST